MATVIIRRTNEYANLLRNYGVYIDGQKIGTIANKQTQTFDVAAGQHTLYFKIDWCSSHTLSFNIADGETKSFTVGGFKHANWLLPMALILLGFTFIPGLKYSSGYLFYPIMAVFVLLIYYITFGRKRYLSLRENNR